MKKFLAFIIDIFISFGVVGYIIALITGNITSDGFELHGIPALILFAEVALYFTVLKKKLGNTLGRKILKIQ
ncbi:MAG TPA: RDD family protein [Candidatus Methanoperedens sp.]|nr:RDD family protein [Candidatus Methanoperedens sp.]